MSPANRKAAPSASSGSNGADSQVGYRKPPRAYTWTPGQSGNPKGRRKGAKNESTVIREVLTRKIEIRIGGHVRKTTVLEAIILKMVEDSLKGNTKSAAFLLNRFAALVSGELQPQDMSEDDRAVLEAFAQQAAARNGSGETP
jgi:hypothetical protein